MKSTIPNPTQIYHILHVNQLTSVVSDGFLWSDRKMRSKPEGGLFIGMEKIKNRRQNLTLNVQEHLAVGDCVPFYFCPRSVMLYILQKQNHPEVSYQGGQEPILHLCADLIKTVQWAEMHGKKWAFTDSNAGSYYFHSYHSLRDLDKINWNAVNARDWKNCREEKMAEFLIEESFPWELVEKIGVYSDKYRERVCTLLRGSSHFPSVEVKRQWYY